MRDAGQTHLRFLDSNFTFPKGESQRLRATSVTIRGVQVMGVGVDEETRCVHYHGERDIIAIKFKCCGNWFPCHTCHAELAEHPVELWAHADFDTSAVLCGDCGHQLTIREYLDCDSTCPRCRRQFNPGCANHYHLYFESPATNVGGALVPRSSGRPDTQDIYKPSSRGTKAPPTFKAAATFATAPTSFCSTFQRPATASLE